MNVGNFLGRIQLDKKPHLLPLRLYKTARGLGSTDVRCHPSAQVSGFTAAKSANSVLPFDAIPGPNGLPYFGTFLKYKTGAWRVDRLQDVLLYYYRQYGPIMKETLNGTTVVHLFDPDFVETYFRQEAVNPATPSLLEVSKEYRIQRRQSLGLGNTAGDEWYRLRSGVQQVMLKPREVTRFLSDVDRVAEEFVQKIQTGRNKSGELPDFRDESSRWTLETAWSLAFQSRLGCIQDRNIEEARTIIDSIDEIVHVSTAMRFSPPWFKYFPTPKRRRVFAAEDKILNTVKRHMDKAVAEMGVLAEKGALPEDHFIFLRHLMSQAQLEYKDILILTLSLPFDAVNTTSRIFHYNLYCLAKNPDVQEKLHKEIALIYHDDDPLTAEQLGQMSYLKACVKESFRFFPIGLEISRVTHKDMTIGGYHIPAGTQVEMNNFVMARMPDYFPDPERYLPERWTKHGAEQDVHPFILLPFGHGHRMCVGRRFAEQELYTLIAKLVRRFRIEWHHDDLDMTYRVLMEPDRPTQFRFVDRV